LPHKELFEFGSFRVDPAERRLTQDGDGLLEREHRLDPFAAPEQGRIAVKEAERCVKDLGLKGFKFHAGSQRFYANDRRYYPLWEKMVRLSSWRVASP